MWWEKCRASGGGWEASRAKFKGLGKGRQPSHKGFEEMEMSWMEIGR